ncbi:glycoside hydrolase [Kribbella capetownensis]|uniref:Xylan alpha-1,2-glucuronidase n=1 Tax=Kribbella capetownensis TaxID=1572659 RepID=A0A4R0JX90_9ACTN|nr:alpha-glucuronidase family glycosyl hydrolase [Kribbella capetownensis]TCC50854.1 glycoside hydrolase [Kribbella capetownensis]
MRFTRRQVLLTGGALAAGGLLRPEFAAGLPDEDGYELWLRYRKVDKPDLLAEYRRTFTHLVAPPAADGDVLRSAATEVLQGLSGLTGRTVTQQSKVQRDGAVIIGTPATSALVAQYVDRSELRALGPDGYVVLSRRIAGHATTVVASEGKRGVLYGIFHLLRLLQTQRDVRRLDIHERPANALRLVDHWDNLDRSVERGYAGESVFDWDALPTTGQRMTDYARTLASVGISGTVVNNVNANPVFLSTDMLQKLTGLAAVLRTWGLTLHLSANFAAPISLGGLATADPFDEGVQAWWRDKAREIYQLIPDFGGFLVKADSEGQPGPVSYGRTHADGANLLARAVKPYGGIVMWRGFIHDFDPVTWASKSYLTFQPLDGKFDPNVIVQVKNGPIDFQVREPVHPLFGAMPQTRLMAELQITQEYTGQSTHLCYLVPEWKQVYDFDTHAARPEPTVAGIVEGAAGVMNFGSDRNWTRHPLNAANTHGYARLVWNPALAAEEVAEEWVRMTFGSDDRVVRTLTSMLLGSWETYEDYTSPLGSGFLIGIDHFTPSPESNAPWNRADAEGAGFDRTVATGVGFTAHYHPPLSQQYESLASCPDELLMFIHHVPYSHRLHSGKTMIQHIYDTHFDGLDAVHGLRASWRSLRSRVDRRRYDTTLERLDRQVEQATLWRDSIVGYYFDKGRVLDESRSWVQLKQAGDQPLLGGWPNLFAMTAGNASPRQAEVTAKVVETGGWKSSDGHVSVPSRETVPFTVPVTPPLLPQITMIDLECEAGGMPALGTSTQVFVTPAGGRCRLALDAGPESSPLLAGYQRLSPSDAWDPDRGFGWVGTAPQARDRGNPDVLRRDFVNDTAARVLRIRIPAGKTDAYALIGESLVHCQPMTIRSEGKVVAALESLLLHGTYTWLKLSLDGGAGGRDVDLEFSSIPDEHWHLDALVIPDPSLQAPALVMTDAAAPSPMLCGRDNTVTVSVANTTSASQTATVRVPAPPGWTAGEATAVVPAGAIVQVAVTVVPGPDPAVLALDVEVATNGEMTDRRRTDEVLTTPPGDSAVLALDAGTDTSPLQGGYQRLAPGSAWSASAGIGWVGTAPMARDRELLDDVRRDFVNDTTVRTLRLTLPDGPHDAWLLVGDATQPSDPVTIKAAGTELAVSPLLPNATFTWLKFTVPGGQTDLELSAPPGKNWRLNALVIS